MIGHGETMNASRILVGNHLGSQTRRWLGKIRYEDCRYMELAYDCVK
jgi:hypothetical protein